MNFNNEIISENKAVNGLNFPQSTNKKDDNICYRLFYGVDKLSNMEPFSYSTKTLYSELISIMKQSTQEYYNMRITLGLECA